MTSENRDERIENLTLLLLYLNSWEEKEFVSPVRRAWKTHNFSTLDELEEKEYITQTRTAKSLYPTPAGIEKAKKLLPFLEQMPKE